MDQTFALNLFSDPGFSGEAIRLQTPEKIGEGLFKSILVKEDRRTSASREKGIENDLQDLGLPPGMLSWRPDAGRKLVCYLKDHGMTENDAESLVKAATGEDGFIQLNRLMSALGGRKGAASENQNALMISSRDVPRFQELLFKMGLGVSDVKALFEQGSDGKGNMMVSKIVVGLTQKFPDMDSEEKLVALLSGFGIECRSGNPAQQIRSSDLNTLMQAYAETSSEDVQKRIKTILAGLLREKGVPPEQVKSFLESMTIEYAETISGSEAAMGEKDAAAAESGLWNGIVFKPQEQVKNDPWTEKILAILKDVQTGVREGGRGEDNSLSFILSEAAKKAPSEGSSAGERGISLLGAEKIVAHPGGRRKVTGNESDSRLPFSSGSTASAATDLRAGTGNMLRTAQQAGTPAHAVEYAQTTSTIPAILDRMQWMVRAGSQEARIQLSPPELGHIDLRLVIENGHVQAQLSAENPVVKELIESNLGQLKQQLAGLGFVVDEFSVHVGADNRKSGGEDDLWERSAGVGRLRGKRNIRSEILGNEPAARRPIIDNHYQINVQV